MRPPAARPEITMAYLGNHWKMNVFHVRAAAIRCGPLSPSAPPGKSYGYCKTLKIIGKTCFFACVAGTFSTDAYGVPRTLSRNIGMVPPGEAQEKCESQRYSEWQRRSQQRAQCAPASTTNTPFLANRNSKIKTSLVLVVQAIRPDLQACYMC